MAIKLNFFGIGINVESSNPNILEKIKRDFSHFIHPKNTRITASVDIEIIHKNPPYLAIPKEAKKAFHTKDSVNYDLGEIRFSDHLGKALTIYDFSRERGQIYSQDDSLLHERTYLLILSRVGDLLDRHGIHRVHALGVSIKDRAVLCLLPMRGGKTTLALELLKEEDIKLISDEIPLMTGNCEILPFPSRLGVLDDVTLDIPPKYLRRFKRSQYDPKTLIDIDYFEGLISTSSSPYIVLIGKRDSRVGVKLRHVSKVRTIPSFWINSVLGKELPHTASYFMRFNLKDILIYFKIFFSRLTVCFKVIRRSKTYRFYMGSNPRENAKFLANFLKPDSK